MNPVGYTAFYAGSFGLQNGKLPKDQLDLGGERKKAWTGGPAAAFPTYSFAVKKGQGLNLAVPLQGVPIGLSLMSSSEAVGSVSIRNARTIGVDIVSLHEQLVEEWWPDHAGHLAKFAPSRPDQHNYVRVISRVYLTGEVDISLRDTSDFAAGADVAAPKPTELLVSSGSETGPARISVEDYKKNLDALNHALEKSTSGGPGGSVRVTSASTRTIGLKETLVPPLVIGYLGFDCEILEGGVLGPAIPTHALLSKLATAPSGPADRLSGTEERYAAAADAAEGRGDQGNAAFRAAAQALGSDWVRLYTARLGSGQDYKDAFGDLALVYWTREDGSTDYARQAIVAGKLEDALTVP
jgi:hypothetical protein